MANRTVSVKLVADIGQYVTGMEKAAASTALVGASAKSTVAQAQQAEKATASWGGSIGSKLEKVASSAGLASSGFSAALLGAGALAGGIGLAASKASEFEQSMSAVQAATKASASTLGELRAAAIKAGADTQYSATEAADAITEMAKAGVSAKDIMGGGLTGALNLAAAGQMDVADAAGIASTAMVQFKLSGEDLPHVADLLAAGAGKAMGSVSDLGQALNQAGLIASQSGVSIEETTGTLAAFASAGLLGSDAGTSFKTMMQMLQNPTKQSAILMDQYGISLYNAQGQFVGMSALAGELQTAFSGLTPAVRDQAMAQIFGSDAVRAANVLYTDGAQGISDWTKKVNDAGYAQDQATKLTDNLRGDLERLGGSFDTLMISLGSGAQGPLRDVVQGLGGAVDTAGSAIKMFSDMPGALQIGLVALGGWALAGDKITASLQNVGGKLSPLKDGTRAFGEALDYARANGDGFTTVLKSAGGYAGGQAVTAFKKLGQAIGPELGVAAATYLVVNLASSIKQVATAGDDAADQIHALNGQINSADSNSGRFDTMSSSLDTLKQKAADAKAVMDKFEDRSWVSAHLNPFSADSSDAIDAKKSFDEYTAAIDRLQNKQRDTTAVTGNLAAQFGMTRDEVVSLADKYNVDLSDGITNAYVHFQSAYTAEQQAAGGATVAAGATQTLADKLEAASDAASDAKKATDQFKTSLDILTGAHVSMIELESNFQAALAEASGAMKDLTGQVMTNKGELDLHSEAGRKAADVLLGVRDSGNQLIAEMLQQGATTDQVKAKDAELRDGFIKTAQQMGISKDAANKLADQILGIPDQRITTIRADTGQATAAVDDLQGKINQLAKDRTASINFRATLPDLNGSASGSGRPGMATGGYVRGAGTGTSDSIPVNLSNGEYVVQASTVRAVGVDNLDALNHGRMGYASGGLVTLNARADTSGALSGLGSFENRLSSAVSGAVQSGLGAAVAAPGGGVERWRPIVLQVLSMLGISPTAANGVLSLIKSESGGNPTAINLTDSNARAGHPSQGLMQTIPATFARWAGPYAGRGITDPLANIYAGVNYALHTYGVGMLTGGGRHTSAGSYLGYANGGSTPAGSPFWVGENGPELMWSSKEQYVSTAAQSREVSGASGGGGASPIVNVNFENASISGRLELDGDGFVRLVDGQVSSALATVVTGAQRR